MTVSHLLDTDICVEVLRRRDRRLLSRVSGAPGVAVSTVTLAELDYGARRSSEPERNLEAVGTFEALVTAIAFDAATAREAGRIRYELGRLGKPIGPYGTLIAAQAVVAGLPLVTRNTREFARVPGLITERW